jgi:hypothetical protein
MTEDPELTNIFGTDVHGQLLWLLEGLKCRIDKTYESRLYLLGDKLCPAEYRSVYFTFVPVNCRPSSRTLGRLHIHNI